MKRRTKIWLWVCAVILASPFLWVGWHQLCRPDRWPGQLLLEMAYDGKVKNLENLRQKLEWWQRPRLNEDVQSFLLGKLKAAPRGGLEEQNILGFFASITFHSDQGDLICAEGGPWLSEVVRLGLEQKDERAAQGFVFLAKSIEQGHPCYKPYMFIPESPFEALKLMQTGETGDVRIGQP